MDDRFVEGFDRIVADSPEGPTWEQISARPADREPTRDPRRRAPLVAVGAFALTVIVVGAVAMFSSGGDGTPVGGESSTTSEPTTSEPTTSDPVRLTQTERAEVLTWEEATDSTQVDEVVWRSRYDEMCGQGVWQPEVGLRLAAEYLAQDIAAGFAEDDGSPAYETARYGAYALWLMAAETCPDTFPIDVLVAGPPFFAGGGVFPSTLTPQSVCGPVALGDGPTPQIPSAPLTPDALLAWEATEELGMESEFFEEFTWFVADDTEGFVLFGQGTDVDGAPMYAYATFENSADKWRATSWGGCSIEVVAEGWGGAEWVVDPDQPFAPDSDVVHILIREADCASGEPPVGRDVVPIVVYEDSRVTINVFVEPLGMATCPSNPWHPVAVEITEPLDGRDLYDGREVPPVLVWSSDGTSLGPDDR